MAAATSTTSERPDSRPRLSSTLSHSAPTAQYARAAEKAAKNPNLRRLSLLGSFLVALSAGSNYAFSSWAPQMQEAAHLSSTSLNIVGLAGNAGVYLSGPFVGRWVDKSGPRQALVFGAILVAAGYASLSASLTSAWSFHSTTALSCFNLLTGLGNSAAFAAAMNAQAKSWDGSKRGSATAFVLSGFGLSAFFYSTLSHSLFPGNTADYLLLLSLGSATSYMLGYLIIKVLPPADSPLLRRRRTISSGDANLVGGASGAALDGDLEAPGQLRPSLASSRYKSRRRSSSDIGARVWLNPDEVSSGGEDEDADEDDEGNGYGERQGLLHSENASADQLEGGTTNLGRGLHGKNSRARPATDDRAHPSTSASLNGGPSPGQASTGAVDITGWKLARNTDFILLFFIMTAISGSGLLLINNCGTITRTLYDYNKRKSGDGAGDGASALLGAVGLPSPTFAALGVAAKKPGSKLALGSGGVASSTPASSVSAVHNDANGRSWTELLHASLSFSGSSLHTNKIVYNPHKAMMSLRGPFTRRDGVAGKLAASNGHLGGSTGLKVAAIGAVSNLTALALDEHALVQQLQAHQVSAISLGNALGRIIIGLLSDVLVNYTSPPMRVWLLTLVCSLAVTSQTLAALPNVVTTVPKLLIVSSLTGLMYGTLFGISPSLAFEWFGVKHFSQNWGIISLSPVVAGNVFNLLFGRVYDAHVPADSEGHKCPYGEECYRSVFVVTTACCLVATVLSVVLIIRRAGWPSKTIRTATL